MRLGKPAADATWALRFDWWRFALAATVLLAAWFFGVGRLLLWAAAAFL